MGFHSRFNIRGVSMVNIREYKHPIRHVKGNLHGWIKGVRLREWYALKHCPLCAIFILLYAIVRVPLELVFKSKPSIGWHKVSPQGGNFDENE